MSQTDYRMINLLRAPVARALLILPAVALGVLAMIRGGVSPALWGQQAVAWMLLALLAEPMRRAARRIPDWIWCIALVLFLALSLFGREVEGARRWVNLGVFQANAAQLTLPALLVVLCRASCPYPLLIAAAAVISFQPDSAALAAFAAAAVPILWQQKRKMWGVGSAMALAALAIRCFGVPVSIEPVPYCEGILDMLAGMSPLLRLAGWMALAAVPAYFAYRFVKCRKRHMLSLALYYAVSMLLVLSGEQPVMFMGFGLSPIAGYYLAYACEGEL